MITRFRLASLLIFAIYGPACAQWSPPQALPLSENRDAWQPAASWGRDFFLVAWKSGHLGAGDLRKGFQYLGDIVACRVDNTGKALDQKPVTVCAAADLQERPRIAFGQGVFMVVWQDFRNGKDWDVYAARVAPDGKVLDPDGIPVSTGPHSQALPELAWDGKVFQVVWQDFRSDVKYEIFGARIGPDGKVLDPQGHVLATSNFTSHLGAMNRFGAVIASTGTDGASLMFSRGLSNNKNQPIADCYWIESGKVRGAAAYETRDDRSAPGGGSQANSPMCLSAGPEKFVGAWTTHAPLGRGNASNDAHAAVFSKEGKLEKKFQLYDAGAPDRNRIRNPSAVWSGSNFVLAWDQYDHEAAKAAKMSWPVEVVCAASVAADGTVASLTTIAGSAAAPAIRPCVASNGAGVTLVAYEQHPQTGDVPIRIDVQILTGGKR